MANSLRSMRCRWSDPCSTAGPWPARTAAWLSRGRRSLRNLAYDDKQVTSQAIFNHVCAESCVRTCARAEVNALRAYLNQSESPRTIRFVRRLDDFYKLLRCVVFIGLVGDGGGSPLPLWRPTAESN